MSETMPETRPETMEFIGVRTGSSSSLRLFDTWAEVLGIPNARLVGCDLPLDADPDRYRAVVDRIAADPGIRGALVTTHKVGIHAAAADRFDELDPLARLCGEISCISKRDGRLLGHAKDPVTAGRALDQMIGSDHFARTGGDVLCLGAGGAGIAIAVHFLQAGDRPGRLVLTDTSPGRLEVAREIHERAGTNGPELLTAPAAQAAEILSGLPPGSLVINATGMGKDLPGTPLPEGIAFPRGGLVWELNYRGELSFLHQARAQAAERELRVFDGWLYFLHGWSEHVAQVFDRSVSPALFDELRRHSGQPEGGS